MANPFRTAWRVFHKAAKPVATGSRRSWRAASINRQRLGNCTSHWANAESKGLIFVGLDIIGDRLTEINVTSPTCIREIEAEFPVSITGMLMDAIEARLQK